MPCINDGTGAVSYIGCCASVVAGIAGGVGDSCGNGRRRCPDCAGPGRTAFHVLVLRLRDANRTAHRSTGTDTPLSDRLSGRRSVRAGSPPRYVLFHTGIGVAARECLDRTF